MPISENDDPSSMSADEVSALLARLDEAITEAAAVSAALRRQVADLHAARRRAEDRHLELFKDQVMDELAEARERLDAAAVRVRRFAVPSQVTEPLMVSFTALVSDLAATRESFVAAVSRAVRANGWETNSPEHLALTAADGQDLVRDGERMAEYLQAAIRSPQHRTLFLAAAAHVQRNGYRSGSGLPCPHCAGPQDSYDDNEYRCLSCW